MIEVDGRDNRQNLDKILYAVSSKVVDGKVFEGKVILMQEGYLMTIFYKSLLNREGFVKNGAPTNNFNYFLEIAEARRFAEDKVLEEIERLELEMINENNKSFYENKIEKLRKIIE